MQKTRMWKCGHCGHGFPVLNGEWARSRRNHAGLTLRELAARQTDAARVGHKMLGAIEAGARRATPAVVKLYESL